MMINQNVIVYLNTPLLESGLEGGKIENIFRLKGKVLAQAPEGFFILVKSAGDEKKWDDRSDIGKIFLPLHKIDFVAIE
ncbi:MAG: hypothetical protein HY541_06910 [Deltaproteobacteria bacterium]|nr:hypothetical protein [Deltaproteobacteria bacterium]